MKLRWSAALVAVAAIVALGLPQGVRADGAWLDRTPIQQWNRPGMSIPNAPMSDPSNNARCISQTRPVETLEDYDLSESGWMLEGAYQAGWGTTIVWGISGFDGMCRPLGFNYFVFQYGTFAGTLSPTLMNSREDGQLSRVFLNDGRITAGYVRYTPSDALCCPSSTTTLMFTIQTVGGSPVVVAGMASTSPNS